jgi:protein ImuB
MRDLSFDYNGTRKERCYLCIYFPEWSIDVTRRALEARSPAVKPKAILLTSTVMNQQVVIRACPTAQSRGVRQGMSVSMAQALTLDSTHLEPFSPQRDLQALKALAVWCLKFSPIVGLDSELSKLLSSPSYTSKDLNKELASLDARHYGIVIDLTGTERLYLKKHRDLASFAGSIHELFRGTARIAIAPSIAGAWALSRYVGGPPTISPSLKDLAARVAPLPTEALRIDHTTSQKLADVGILTIGDLDHVPRHSLGQRFGAQLLCRTSQLFGSISEQIFTVAPQAVYLEHATFEPALTHRRAILSTIEHLFARLLTKLSRHQIAAKLFALSIYDLDNNTNHKELSLATATGDTSHLKAIITPVLESLIFCGEIKAISLEARDTSRISPSQSGFYDEQDYDPDQISRGYKDLMNSFSIRLGRDRVHKAKLSPSHTPELSFSYTPETSSENSANPPLLREPESPAYLGAPYQSAHYQIAPYQSAIERPPILFAPPEPIISIAMLPDRPPAWIKWRGAKLTITNGFGPERIAPEWWRGRRDSLSERDYFTVEDHSGRWLWVFRCLTTQRWFIHGVWR